jgi:hypothetical protein
MVGWLASETSTIDVGAFSAMVGKIRRIAVGNRAQFMATNRAIAAHGLRPVIDRAFPSTRRWGRCGTTMPASISARW